MNEKGKHSSQESNSSVLEYMNFLLFNTLLSIVTNCLAWICHMEKQECNGCFTCGKSSSLGVSQSDTKTPLMVSLCARLSREFCMLMFFDFFFSSIQLLI